MTPLNQAPTPSRIYIRKGRKLYVALTFKDKDTGAYLDLSTKVAKFEIRKSPLYTSALILGAYSSGASPKITLAGAIANNFIMEVPQATINAITDIGTFYFNLTLESSTGAVEFESEGTAFITDKIIA